METKRLFNIQIEKDQIISKLSTKIRELQQTNSKLKKLNENQYIVIKDLENTANTSHSMINKNKESFNS